MEQIIYLIHSRASIGRTLEGDIPHNAVLMKIPLVRLSWPREGGRPLSVCGGEALASSGPAAPPHLPPDGTTRAQSDSSYSRLYRGHSLSDPPLSRDPCYPLHTPPLPCGHASCSPFLFILPSDFYGGGVWVGWDVKWERSLPALPTCSASSYPAGLELKSGNSILLRNLGFLGKEDPAEYAGQRNPPHPDPAVLPSRREDESEGSRVGPQAPPTEEA